MEHTAMKKYTAYIGALAALLVTGAAVTACADQDFINEAQQPELATATGKYTMTRRATMARAPSHWTARRSR